MSKEVHPEKVLRKVPEPFKTWWDNEGSSIRPLLDEDLEEFAKRISNLAYRAGYFYRTNSHLPPSSPTL